MFKKFLSCSLILMGMSAAVVNADPVVVTYLSAFDGTTEKGTINGDGFYAYTGLYNITVDGTAYKTFCIDPLGGIDPNDTWYANHLSAEEIAAGNGELFTATYSNTAVALEKYAMINYLADKSFYLYTDMPDSRLDSPAERSDLSLLYWEIALDYNGSLGSMNLEKGEFTSTTTSMNTNLSDLLSEAYNHKSDELTMSIFSPLQNPSQEFLAFKVASVPEPAVLPLLGIGLFMIGLSVRRKKS